MKILLTTLGGSRAQRYKEQLAGSKWRVVAWPLIETRETGIPAPQVKEEPFWVAVTSPRVVPFLKDLVERPEGSWRSFRIAAIGPATVYALRKAGLPVHVVSKDGTGRALAAEIARFPSEVAPVVWPAAKEPAGGLAEGLGDHGFQVHHWPVYQVVSRRPAPRLPVDLPVEAVLVTSPSNVKALKATGTGSEAARFWIAMGPTTARALREAGYPVDRTAARPSPAAVVCLLEDLTEQDEEKPLGSKDVSHGSGNAS